MQGDGTMSEHGSEAADAPSWRIHNNKDDYSVRVEDIIRSSCPLKDDVRKLKPYHVDKVDYNSAKVGGRASSSSLKRLFYIYIPPQLCTEFTPLVEDSSSPTITQKRQKIINSTTSSTSSLRVILAIHGFGGRPLQEIRKWHDVAVHLNSIIIAPQGMPTEDKLGWNAIDCEYLFEAWSILQFILHYLQS